MDKTAEYLRLLQEKNRLKKMMSTKSKDEQAKEELEKGFTTHFRGAHAVKDSKMPVPTKTTASVKPINILGRIAQGANIMWGHEKKGDATSPNSTNQHDKVKRDSHNSDAVHQVSQEDREDNNHFSEYESDFDDCSDAETDSNALHTYRATERMGLPMPSVIEEDDDDFFRQHNEKKPGISDGVLRNPLTESVALDNTLQTRVKDLSAQQKLKLLKLLELDLSEEAGAAPTARRTKLDPEDDVSPMKLEEVVTPATNGASMTGKSLNSMRSNEESEAQKQFGSASPLRKKQAEDVKESHLGELHTHQPGEAVEETTTVTLRIRITTTWSAKARFVSLGAVRLRMRQQGIGAGIGAGSSESSAVDLLPLLTARLCSGLAPLPSGSEPVRSLSQLLGGSSTSTVARRPASAYRGPASSASAWKGPISPESPLELQFSGELPTTALDGLGLGELELLVWNCSAAPLTSACARDVDVFVSNKCVWSGQLDEGESATTAASATASVRSTTLRPGEVSPSLVLFPWRTDQAPVPRLSDEPSSRSQATAMDSASGKDESTSTGTEKPNWLGLKDVSQGPDRSGNNHNDLIFSADSPSRSAAKNSSTGRARLRASEVTSQTSESTAAPNNINSNANNNSEGSLAFGSPKRRVSAAGKRVSSALAKEVEAEDQLIKGGTEIGRRRAGRSVADSTVGTAGEASDEEAVVGFGSKTKASPSPSGARRRAARRDRNHLLKDAQQGSQKDSNTVEGVFDALNAGGFSPERKIANKKQREAELKKSIDSMAFNDKFNLGRLSASKLPYVRADRAEELGEEGEELLDEFPILAPSQFNPDNFGDDSLDGPSTPLRTQDFTQNLPVQQNAGLLSPSKKDKELLLSSPQRKAMRHGSSALGYAATASTGQVGEVAEGAAARAARDSDRTAKIDLVQEKITSTIAGLAKIMSGIPSGGISLAKSESTTKIDFPIDSAAQQYTPPRPFSLRTTADLSPAAGKRSEVVKPPAEVKPWHKKEAGAGAMSTAKSAVPSTSIASPHTFVVEIDSNWGDANYVGLNGLELYDTSGSLIQLQHASSSTGRGGVVAAAGVRAITAYPKDLTDLPEHRDDPRKVQNLLNGINFTKNDMHSWLAPHLQVLRRAEDPSTVQSLPYIARVVLELDSNIKPVMCRIFNYNRSRTRNQRGARRIKLLLDDKVVFEGDLKKATGQLQSVEAESEVIFLDEELSEKAKVALRSHLVRSRDADLDAEEEFGEVSAELDEQQQIDQLEQSWAELSMSRPKTSAGVVPPPAQSSASSSSFLSSNFTPPSAAPATATPAVVKVASIDSLPDTALPSQTDLLVKNTEGLLGSNQAPVPVVPLGSVEQPRSTGNRLGEAVNEQPAPVKYVMTQDSGTGLSKMNDTGVKDVVPASASCAGTTTRTMVSAFCRVLRLSLLSTWGDASYVGLCGLEVLVGPNFAPAKIGAHQLRAQPKDLSEIGCYDDPRVLGNLVNGVNNTADDTVMWIIPFTQGSEHFLEVDLLGLCDVVGIRVWNYNKSSEQVLRGCRQLAISGDGKHLCQCLLRMGPGTDGVCFGQTILFSELADIQQGSHPHYAPPSRLRPGQQREARLTTYLSPAIRQDFETPLNPTGLLWKFTFFDNWNDGYYVGLDALEFFDSAGRLIDMAAVGAQVQAVPYSVQDLAGNHHDTSSNPPHLLYHDDPRTPSQLFSRQSNHPADACWLAPLARCMTPAERAVCVRRALRDSTAAGKTTAGGSSDPVPSLPLNNVLYVMFQHPVTVSAIRLFNYSKTPSRGVRDFQVEVDSLYLYMGSLLRADREKLMPQIVSKAAGSVGTAAGSAVTGKAGISRGQSVLFTNDPKVLQVHRETVSYCGAGEQDLLCINERQVMVRSKNMYDQEPPNTSLEGVRSDLEKRPMTAAVSNGRAHALR